MRFRAADLRPHGWRPLQTLHIPDWCGCTTEYLPVPEAEGWWRLVPIWDPDQAGQPAPTVRARGAALTPRGHTTPSSAWRAAFLRPPTRLTTVQYTSELGRRGLDGARVTFRTTPPRLHAWLRRIDTWIEYANSVVAE